MDFVVVGKSQASYSPLFAVLMPSRASRLLAVASVAWHSDTTVVLFYSCNSPAASKQRFTRKELLLYQHTELQKLRKNAAQ